MSLATVDSSQSDSPPRPALFAGTLLLFVTFTQTGGGGATQYITHYLPIFVLATIVVSTYEPRVASNVRTNFLFLFVLILLAGISTAAIQYAILTLLFGFVVMSVPVGALLRHLPTYAYYAAILNVVIYLAEVILVGQLGVPFDPRLFNYIGVERETIITTWGFNRYAGHHTEPGSLSVNLAALTVLSMMGDRKPNLFHWIAVLTLASTLSITAAMMAALVALAIFLSSELNARTVLFYALVIALSLVALFQVLPMLGLFSVDFLLYRLQDRGGSDGSIYVKAVMLEDFRSRGFLATIFGNRHELCYHCPYAKSLGLAFYMLFNGGIFGGFAIAALLLMSVFRLGRKGFALVLVLMLMRIEFYFPQALMMYLAIAGLPRMNQRAAGYTRTDEVAV